MGLMGAEARIEEIKERNACVARMHRDLWDRDDRLYPDKPYTMRRTLVMEDVPYLLKRVEELEGNNAALMEDYEKACADAERLDVANLKLQRDVHQQAGQL